MATATKNGIQQTIDRVKHAWTEMDYAQRRLFEIRTGVPATRRDERIHSATAVDELEERYGREEPPMAA